MKKPGGNYFPLQSACFWVLLLCPSYSNTHTVKYSRDSMGEQWHKFRRLISAPRKFCHCLIHHTWNLSFLVTFLVSSCWFDNTSECWTFILVYLMCAWSFWCWLVHRKRTLREPLNCVSRVPVLWFKLKKTIVKITTFLVKYCVTFIELDSLNMYNSIWI